MSADCIPQIDNGTPAAEIGSGIAHPRTNEPCDTARRRDDEDRQQPSRPGAEQHEPTLDEDRARVLEEELKHLSFEPSGSPADFNRKLYPSRFKSRSITPEKNQCVMP